jgi:hypothetical protein
MIFRKCTREDGKTFSEIRKNEQDVKIIIPNKDKDNAKILICQLSRNDDGDYIGSYENGVSLFRSQKSFYGGHSEEEIFDLLGIEDFSSGVN